jgi:ABC-type nitrate/sulfonate/bicarbonate transport system permease component
MRDPGYLLGRGLTYLGLSVAAFVSVFPFFWMLVGTTNTSADIIKGKADSGGAFLNNLATFFQRVDVPLVFWNSAYIAVTATFLTLAVSSLAGYGFEVFRSRTRERLFSGLLLMLSVPFAALMIPLFTMMGRAGLINTHTAIILPGIASIFMIFYFRQATKAFPHELRDAARIDGLKEWQIFIFIYLPVALHLCGGHDHHLHAELEQLSVAADHPADQQQEDADPGRVLAPVRLLPRFRRDHGRHGLCHPSHPGHLLRPAAPIRRGHAGFREIGLQQCVP